MYSAIRDAFVRRSEDSTGAFCGGLIVGSIDRFSFSDFVPISFKYYKHIGTKNWISGLQPWAVLLPNKLTGIQPPSDKYQRAIAITRWSPPLAPLGPLGVGLVEWAI